jgi:hypothetical protein
VSLLEVYFFGVLPGIDTVCVLLVCRYVTVFSPCSCFLYLGEALCLVCGG